MRPQKNLWPLGIVAAFAVFILGTAALIAIACTHKTDLITPNYYEEEITFQKRLDQIKRTAQLDDHLEIAYDACRNKIRISLPAGQAPADVAGRIQLYRPSATGLDREIALQPDAAGSQILDTTSLLPGLWRVRVKWSARNQDYFADKNIVIERSTKI
jgi:hypothetical protein